MDSHYGGTSLVGRNLRDFLLENPVEARKQHSNVKYWGYFNLLNIVNVALLAMYRVRFGTVKLWMWPCLVIAVGSSLLTTDRTRFFYIALWALFL